MARFTVDTHLFRELGELLVGRDSTALIELIKNAYDADASSISVTGERLDSASHGVITIRDDGVGMTDRVFNEGFLRVASRIKEQGERRSPLYKRRFTGAKGIGRLAAHKLARRMTIRAAPNREVFGNARPIRATIDWDKIESFETIDAIDDSAITLDFISKSNEGTTIELSQLKRKWTPTERYRVIQELASFRPPEVLLKVPSKIVSDTLLFEEPRIRDIGKSQRDPGFEVELAGDFDVGDEYWDSLIQAADWILEIEADRRKQRIKYSLTPTQSCKRQLPNAEQHKFYWGGDQNGINLSFQARILIREGSEGIRREQRPWLVKNAGIKIYMEGFRVLPYGDAGDDWLELDRDYAQRTRTLRYLESANLKLERIETIDDDAGLAALGNRSYFGAAFLTMQDAPGLEMLVNREGFIPNTAFDALRNAVRIGIDLSVRARAFERVEIRNQRREQRTESRQDGDTGAPNRMKMREAADEAATRATELAREARQAAAAGKHEQAEKLITSAAKEIQKSTSYTSELVSDRSIMQILAGVGLQMSAFVHELNGLLGMALAIEKSLDGLRLQQQLDKSARQQLAKVSQSVSDLRRVVERQASYLTDITSPDARRRRSRQYLHERLNASISLLEVVADKRSVDIENRIPEDLKTPPMFPAELMVVFTNLLTNAIKASGKNGRIRATAKTKSDGTVILKMENTGRRVRLSDSEKWFLPFKSTTIEAQPGLGQGMGMGLPIVRNILEEYGAAVRFVEPSENFATALEVAFT